LSYLAGRDVAVWKQQFIQLKIEESEEAKTDEPSWGTYKEFIEALKKTFQPYDEPAEALEDMKKLHLGDSSIMEHNSRFHLLVSQTRETLLWGLQGLIIQSKHPPKTLEEWYTKATNFYVGHQRAQRLFKKRDNKPVTTSSALPAQKKFSFPEKKDPNAMDIDRMSIEEGTCLSGFHQVALRLGLNGLWLQGLKEYSDSYLTLDYLGPILGSKCLVTQTIGDYLGLGPSQETTEKMF
jgi:hypothetical protein